MVLEGFSDGIECTNHATLDLLGADVRPLPRMVWVYVHQKLAGELSRRLAFADRRMTFRGLSRDQELSEDVHVSSQHSQCQAAREAAFRTVVATLQTIAGL